MNLAEVVLEARHVAFPAARAARVAVRHVREPHFLADDVGDACHARRGPDADVVERHALRHVEVRDDRLDEVAHVEVRLRLAAVAEDFELVRIFAKFLHEIMDDAVREVRPDDVREAEHERVHVVHVRVRGNERLAAELRRAVIRDGREIRRRLAEEFALFVAIDRRRRREEETFHAACAHRLQEMERRGIRVRVLDGGILRARLDVGVRREMQHAVRLLRLHNVEQPRLVADVLLIKMERCVFSKRLDIFPRAEIKIIDARDGMAVRQQDIDQVAADEAGTARDQNTHSLSPQSQYLSPM